MGDGVKVGVRYLRVQPLDSALPSGRDGVPVERYQGERTCDIGLQ